MDFEDVADGATPTAAVTDAAVEKPPMIDDLQETLFEELVLALPWRGAWPPELLATTSECLTTYILNELPEDAQHRLTSRITRQLPILDEVEDEIAEDELAVAYVECVGASENFVSIFAGEWADPEYLDCLAIDLTIEDRVELLEQYGQFHEEWFPLLEDCGWVSPYASS